MPGDPNRDPTRSRDSTPAGTGPVARRPRSANRGSRASVPGDRLGAAICNARASCGSVTSFLGGGQLPDRPAAAARWSARSTTRSASCQRSGEEATVGVSHSTVRSTQPEPSKDELANAITARSCPALAPGRACRGARHDLRRACGVGVDEDDEGGPWRSRPVGPGAESPLPRMLIADVPL